MGFSIDNDGRTASMHTELPHRAPGRGAGLHERTATPFAAAHPYSVAPTPEAAFGADFVTQLIDAVQDTLAMRTVPLSGAREVARQIAQLALLANGRVTPAPEESRNVLRASYLHVANRLLASHMHRADLSPLLVARALGISVRKLHLLFEPTGLSFSRTLMSMRLAETRRRLTLEPRKHVAEIAFACGFDSLATFYRAFRQAYRMTPGDLRQAEGGAP
ncbi:helix-turn-helix transcriptional regulator [Afipia sp. P52-10]|uniref:helix-turn-helix transcriptional regulator n=1 Tax=Afipia sp. P52-10 TaxID=1429916 RepID=UPI0004ADED2F|nr:helix-turn-helix transcriptional regulator [Afipia sp. P52-10]